MMKVILLGFLCCLAAACSAGTTNHYSAVPSIQRQARDYGTINSPSNTGNPPTDIDPHTPHWGD